MMNGAEETVDAKEEEGQSAAISTHSQETPRRSSSGRIQRTRTSSRSEKIKIQSSDVEHLHEAKYFLNLKEVHDSKVSSPAHPLPSPDSPGYNSLSPASKVEEKARRQGRPFPPDWRELYTPDQAKKALHIAVAASPRADRIPDDVAATSAEEHSTDDAASARKSPKKRM